MLLVISTFPLRVRALNLDSLLNAIELHQVNDTSSVNLLIKIAKKYQRNNPDSAIYFANKAGEIAIKSGFQRGYANSLIQNGIAYQDKFLFDSSFNNFERANQVFKSINYPKGQASAIFSQANLYLTYSKYGQALDYFNKSLTISEEIKDTQSICQTYLHIAYDYNNMGDFTHALSYSLKALTLFELLKDTDHIIETNTHIATIYASLKDKAKALDYIAKSLQWQSRKNDIGSEMGNLVNIAMVYGQLEDNENALIYFKKVLHIADSISDDYYKNICLVDIAEIYYGMGNYESAYPLYINYLDIAEKTNDHEGMALAHYGIGNILVKRGNFKEGLGNLEQSYQIFKDNGMKKNICEVSHALSMAYEQARDFNNALKYQKIYFNYNDSIYSEQNAKSIQKIQYEYDLEKKENQIKTLENNRAIALAKSEKQKITNIALLAGLGLVVIILILVLRSRRFEQRSKEKIQVQAKRLEELNQFKDKTFSVLSHDLRGPLGTLSTTLMMLDLKLISPEEFAEIKPVLSNKLVSLTLLLENLLNWSKTYMMGESVTHPSNTNLSALVDENMKLLKDSAERKQIGLTSSVDDNTMAYCDKEQIDIVIRNIINNSIKFTKPGGDISLTSHSENGKVKIIIADNGIGMTKEQLAKLFIISNDNSTYGTKGEKGTGLGLMLSYGFVKENRGTLEVESQPGKGSTFTIILPANSGS